MSPSPNKFLKKRASSDSGLTLLECLVAISVIALTSALIAPVMVLSVATRVQNQKAEQALQLARGEVDRIRLIVERQSTYTSADLKLFEDSTTAPLRGTVANPSSTDISSISSPTSLANVSTWSADTYVPTSALVAKEIDSNGDSTPDFIIQSFRSEAVSLDTMPVAFDMGVRVYDYDAVTADDGSLISGLGTTAASLGFTSGEGQRGQRPLAVLYTQIVNSDEPLALCEYTRFLQQSVPSNMNCS